MNKGDEISLTDLNNSLGYFHIKIDIDFLKNLLVEASNSAKPHYNKEFIDNLDMRFTKNKNSCLTIYSWLKGNKTIPLNKLVKIANLANKNWDEIQLKIISLKAGQNRGEINPNFPIKIDKKLGSIVGHILGDGSIDLTYQQLFFSNSNKELLREFEKYMEEIFRAKPRIWMQKKPDFGNTEWDRRLNNIDEIIEGRNCGLYYPSACGLILNEIFKNFAIGKNKKVTEEILKTNKEFKKGLIRAFYDDEGNVRKKGGSIRLFQDRKDILETFRELLKEFGITSNEIKTYIKAKKERYYFDIFRKTNFIKFQDEIGFTSPKKGELLKEICVIKNKKNSK